MITIILPLLIGGVVGWVFMADYLDPSEMGDRDFFVKRMRIVGMVLAGSLFALVVNLVWVDHVFVRTGFLILVGVCLMSWVSMVYARWRMSS